MKYLMVLFLIFTACNIDTIKEEKEFNKKPQIVNVEQEQYKCGYFSCVDITITFENVEFDGSEEDILYYVKYKKSFMTDYSYLNYEGISGNSIQYTFVELISYSKINFIVLAVLQEDGNNIDQFYDDPYVRSDEYILEKGN